jgi:DNA replication protein DnaC
MSERQRGGVGATLQQVLRRAPRGSTEAPSDAPEPTAGACPDCGGRGWVVVADGGAGTARRCGCAAIDPLPALERDAGIPSRYQGCRLEKLNVRGKFEHLLKAQTLTMRWVDDFLVEGKLRGTGLLFSGPNGVGKTFLAVAALAEVIRRYRVRGRFVDFTTLIYQIQSTFDAGSAETKQSVLDPVLTADVLVLDELGAQKPSPWVSEVLYLILNGRYTRRLPTLFTSNYYLDEPPALAGAARSGEPAAAAPERRGETLSTRIPAMLVSRLWEMARPVVMLGGDYRKDVRRFQTGYWPE